MLSRVMTRKEQLVLLFFASAVLLGTLALYVRSANAPGDTSAIETDVVLRASAKESLAPPVVAEETAAPLASPVVEATPLVVVSIRGEVLRPGVYRLPQSARVADLLDEAGGATKLAELTDINLAAKLIDGTTLAVPPIFSVETANDPAGANLRAWAAQWNPPQYTIHGQAAQRASGTSSIAGDSSVQSGGSQSVGELIDINAASQAELETLPGIGPKLATSIIEYRTQQPFRAIEDLLEVSGVGEKRLDAIRPFVTVR